jgi:hypothetical protein
MTKILFLALMFTALIVNTTLAQKYTYPSDDGPGNVWVQNGITSIEGTMSGIQQKNAMLVPITTVDNENNSLSGTPDNDIDVYLFNTNSKTPIEFNIFIDETNISTAQLSLLTWDVDWACGSGKCERDEVFFNGHYLGYLTGANDEWSTTIFNIDPAWVVPGPSGKNLVRVNVDILNRDVWAVTIDWGQLLINGGMPSTASFRNVDINKTSYLPGEIVKITEEVDANPSLYVRIETNLLNSANEIIAGTDRYLTATTGNEPFTENLALPDNSNPGNYQVVTILYDGNTNLQKAIKYKSFNIDCANPTSGGEIGNAQDNCGYFDPQAITSVSIPDNYTGTLEYKWQYSTNMVTFSDIANSNLEIYDPGLITQTTLYKRLARVTCQSDWIGAAESNVVTMEVKNIPTVTSATATPESVVGSGQVVFSASANAGDIKWFDEPTGGTEVTILNPTISSTTTYYAEAISKGCVSSPRKAVTATVIPASQKQLNFKFANPRITNVSGTEYFEFDIQVKADEAGSYLWSGQIILKFDNTTLSTAVADWFITRPSLFSELNSAGNPKYATIKTITGTSPNKVLNIGYLGDVNVVNNSASSADFVEITNSYQTLASVRGKITSNTGVAGIDFKEVNMDGYQFNKLSANPWYASYVNPNVYDEADFMDTYVERVYCTEYLWTQMEALNWADAVNTSIWDGNATIPDGSLSNASALRIHNSALLTIPVDASLTVSGNTDIKSANGLIIQSNVIGTGSLITATASGDGSVIAQRYMTTDAWHIVSSPLSGQRISHFLTNNANIATSEDDAVRGMMDYNPALNDWNDYFTNATSGNLETGKGFCMRTNANSVVSFNGLLQAGNQSATNLSSENWNSVGNPYTSAIGINKFSQSAANFLSENIDNFDPSYGAIYVWDKPDASNGMPGMYTIIANTPTDAPFVIQQGQAFMIKVNTGVSSVNFNSGMQIHEPALALKSTKNIWPTIKLKAAVNSLQVSTIIAFNNEMTKGLDPTYDAGLFKGTADLCIYSRLVEDNGIPFAIQALPADEYSSLIIPIGLECKAGGEVVFSSEIFNLPSDCKVILEDKQNKIFTDLSQKNYVTTIASNINIDDRFYLHTSNQTTNRTNDLMIGKMSAYAIRNVELIINAKVTDQAIASLYDVLGRLVLTRKLEADSRNSIKLSGIRTGIYMLYVRDSGKEYGFKIPVIE